MTVPSLPPNTENSAGAIIAKPASLHAAVIEKDLFRPLHNERCAPGTAKPHTTLTKVYLLGRNKQRGVNLYLIEIQTRDNT
jgi:hypothetical protein